uniref:Transposase IS4-like domain-containing protein n=1 Tax=Cereibacter sphaeroides (strain ATCC 17025 / ATH 2.4.3) TaxID=349102 RepID=A4WR28_CERS5
MPEYLNCGRLQAEALIRHRVIPRIGENPSTGQFGLNSIAVEDVDAFLDRFRSAGGNTVPPRTEFANVVETSRILRCPAIDIIKLVLAGRLSRVALPPYELKLKSVLVDPEEVRTRLRDGGTDGRLSVIQAAERLGLEAWAVRNLTVATDQEGRVLLPAIEGTDAVGDAKGRPIGFFMSAGQVSDYSGAAALLGSLPKADWLLADRGYDADWLREALKDKGMKVCIPCRKSRKKGADTTSGGTSAAIASRSCAVG